jgi:hypothetical protein
MFTQEDILQLQAKGITEKKIMEQLQSFERGFPYLKIIAAVTPDNGLLQIQHDEMSACMESWDQYLKENHSILKFVPASGAASRMFKDLFEFADGESGEPQGKALVQFFSDICRFAFFDALNEKCVALSGKDIDALVASGDYKTVVRTLLNPEGLNYGQLPKGLLLFHGYENEKRTPFQEHLAEGAMYAMNRNGEVNIHFTVSAEHQELFEKQLQAIREKCMKKFEATFNISFSVQKPSTDTVAADSSNQPFRENGKMVFRPGGHGALIENLNDLNADIIFIKNIDNVVPDALKNPTVIYKKMIAGLLVQLQSQCFAYLSEMAEKPLSREKLLEILAFSTFTLNNIHMTIEDFDDATLQRYLFNKLNRPIRICGMVKNTGEPGGGPFLTVNKDGSVSPQILESSQIDMNNADDKAKMASSTHFNPVDLVCAVKDFRGNKFDLLQYVDPETGFISSKSKNGKELKALELPGLWNGAMSDWNSIFVEVPIATFNPVKTVNDLLRAEHQ